MFVALTILGKMSLDGHIDPDFFDVFVRDNVLSLAGSRTGAVARGISRARYRERLETMRQSCSAGRPPPPSSAAGGRRGDHVVGWPRTLRFECG